MQKEEMRLEKKIALITGGTGELGKALTKKFLDEGADVVVTYRSDADLSEFRTAFAKVTAIKADVTNEEDVHKLFEDVLAKKKGLHILCNLVGGYMPKKNMADLAVNEWDFMFSLNLKTCFLCTREAFRIMQKSRYGRIINVSAMAGLDLGAGRGAYGISKAAVAGLTRIAGEEAKALNSADITINAIAPSIMLTVANKKSADKQETDNWVTLEQAADLICYLASGDAAAINGETIRIYGRV